MTPKLVRGLVQVYTGDGKGKTTAAWGQALRALGQGLRVCFIMFLKGDADLGELHATSRLTVGAQHVARPEGPPRRSPDLAAAPLLAVRQFGATTKELGARSPGRWWQAGFTDDDRRMAHEGLACARDAIASGDYDLVVLDEANVAMSEGLLDVDEVLRLLRERPAHVEVVVTGRQAPPEILEAADLVTEMRAVKHPFARGMRARRGIEH